MWNSAQPLSLSAKIFLHHRQRLRFAFASQIRSITRTSSTNQSKHTWDQSKTTESTAERQLVDPSIFTLASDSGCFLVLSSCVICVPVCDKHNPKAHKAMETQKHYGPTNKISAYAYESQCHFVSTQCMLHKEHKQELYGIVQSLLSEAAQRKHRVTASQTKVREFHSLVGACTGYQVIEPFKSTLFVSAWLLSWVVISGACPPKLLKLNHTSLQLRAAQKQSKKHINKQDKPGLSQFWKDMQGLRLN